MPTTDKPLNFWSQVDWITIALYIGLMAFGWISICGASYTYGENDIFALSTRSGMQIIWIGTSICLGFVILMMDTRFFDTFSYVIYGVLLLLLFATIFNPHDIKGSHSWLVIGPLRLQPAEFGKFATALALAKLMSSYGFNIGRWKHFAAACAVIFIPMLCIVGQRETGSALVYLTFFLVLYREGMPGSILFTGVAMVVYFVVGIKYESVLMLDTPTSVGRFVVLTLVQIFTACMVDVYIKQRRQTRLILGYSLGITILSMLFSVYVIPFDVTWVQLASCAAIAVYLLLAGAGYNVHQSEIAIGSGGLKGKGFLNGTQTKLKFVPEQDTDFIFCTVGEEEGFVGSAGVLLMFLALILRLMKLAERQPFTFGRVYGYCVASVFLFHVFINVGMVLGLTPVIGIPLPFFSYGGSSLWGFTILLFIFLRIDAGRNFAQGGIR